MRTDAIDQSLLLTLSPQRLQKYLENSDGDLSRAITLYERNLAVSEAFYSPLQGVEVCLRNALHSALTARYGHKWYREPAVPLNEVSREQVESAIADLVTRDSHEPAPGSVIAELKFSFWVGLLGPKYDHTLWRGSLHKAFATGAGRTRKTCHSRFNSIRRFRNRVFHHEPIFHKDLAATHREIIEAIGWMCQHTSAWVLYSSRVPQLLQLKSS